MNSRQRLWIFAVLFVGTMSGPARGQVLTAPAAHGITNSYHALTPEPSITPDGLTIAIHGFKSNPAAWPNNVVADINSTLGGIYPNDWQALSFDWNEDAGGGLSPARADELQAQIQGHYLAQQILSIGPAYVHLVGHSLGTRVIESALVKLSQVANPPDLIATYLDAYTPYNWSKFYGHRAAYAESYFNELDLPFTQDRMPYAINVDVSPIRPPEFNDEDNVFNAAELGHSWPPAWYERSVEQFDEDDPPFHGYGYALSTEGGTNSGDHGAFRGKQVTLTAGAATTNGQYLLGEASNAFTSNLGTLDLVAQSGATQDGNELILTVPGGDTQLAWANVEITTTQPASVFDFGFDFTSSDQNNDGVLSFRIRNSNILFGADQLLYVTREVHQLAGWENSGEISYVSAAGGANDLPAGTYTFSFRLDAATAAEARIRLFGRMLLNNLLVPEPSSLAMLLAGLAGVILWRRTKSGRNY